MKLLGIDIGGSGIKAGLVDLTTGEISSERQRVDTPAGAKPEDVATVVADVVRSFGGDEAIGCTFPAIVHHGVTLSAANVDKGWIGADAKTLFEKATGRTVHVLNDADAAGLAEMTYGAGKGRKGVVVMLTFGTGIGSALFLDGKLVPNTEFGHVQIRGKDAEHRASAKVKEDKGWSYKQWAKRVNEYLAHLEFLFSPDLFIIGGGISKRHDKFIPLLKTRAEILPAQLFNDAGIVGAALAASQLVKPKKETPKAEATAPVKGKRGPKKKIATPAAPVAAPTENTDKPRRGRRKQTPVLEVSPSAEIAPTEEIDA